MFLVASERPPRAHKVVRLVTALVLSASALIGAGCDGAATSAVGTGSGSTGPPTTSAASAGIATTSPPAALAWTACADDTGFQCGTVAAPIDYRHPGSGTLQVAVTRARATDGHPVGTLLVNPGGPGESGNQILPVLLGLFPAAVRRSFDIVSFDPRGTGSSDPLRCGTPPSALTSVGTQPVGPGGPLPGTAAFTAMSRDCADLAPGFAPYVDTASTARDMDRIRQALGVRRISYYGLSYGTALGTAYADLFPSRVSAMVLDGAVNVNASLTVQAAQQAPAAERALEHLFAVCAADTACPLGHDPRATFAGLATSLTRRPLPAPGHGDPYPVTVGDLDTATLLALSVALFTPTWESAVEQAVRGNGTPLRALALESATDVDGAPLVDPQWAITCNDAAVHPGPVAAGALARSLGQRYPLLGAYAVTYAMGGCVSWPAARQPLTDVHPSEARPVLVIANTGDPATPLVGAADLATAFPDARLLTWRGWGHTWLLSGPGDTCMQSRVTDYLLDGTLPHRGAVCG